MLENIWNILYPTKCGMCNRLSPNSLCRKCEIKLKNTINQNTQKYTDTYFTEHGYLFCYQGWIRQKMIDYKFNEKSYLYKMFAQIILKTEKWYRFFRSYDIIIPVPIHASRKRQRGYNQCELIAKELIKKLPNLRLENTILVKKVNAVAQSTLNKEERKNNIKDAYFCQNIETIKNKKVLLLDDVYTTGSTLTECSRILTEAGIKQIGIFTIAKD